VLKRDMELAMLDTIVDECRAACIHTVQGYYLPTKKNSMVADHYDKLGFKPVSVNAETKASVWTLEVAGYISRNRHIKILEPTHG